MTLGESIKHYRIKTNLTQKDLAEKLNVSFQTVSKWENDTNEPDVSTLKKMSELFSCSLDNLMNGTDQDTKALEPSEHKEEELEPEVVAFRAECRDCHKSIDKEEDAHYVSRKDSEGLLKQVTLCNECYIKEKGSTQDVETKHDDEDEYEYVRVRVRRGKHHVYETVKRKKGSSTDTTGTTSSSVVSASKPVSTHSFGGEHPKSMIWGIVFGIIAFVASLITFIALNNKIGLGWGFNILMPIFIGYSVLAEIYCIFCGSWVGDVFIDVASWSIKFPGIIFSFDLDGIAFLIAMKILFAVLGFLLGIGVLILAVVLSTFCAIFTFPFAAIKNR